MIIGVYAAPKASCEGVCSLVHAVGTDAELNDEEAQILQAFQTGDPATQEFGKDCLGFWTMMITNITNSSRQHAGQSQWQSKSHSLWCQ